MIEKLKNKVNLWLQDAITAIQYKFDILKQLSNLCHRVENQQYYISKKRGRITAVYIWLLTQLPSSKIQHTLPAYVSPVKR